jgi:uncharacterized protein (TIGR02001 family)
MKSIRTLTLLTGLMVLSGVCQAQFSSTWTAVSDYDYRGWSQSSKNPALQASADYAFGESGFSMGTWASNVDFGEGNDADIELDVYANYVGEINDTFAITAGVTYYTYPGSDVTGDYPEAYVGFNAGNFALKQWYADKLFDGDESAQYTEANYTQPIGDNFSLAFHVGYAWGDAWENSELVDYALQGNWTFNKFTIFAKFTGTDASGEDRVRTDANNNEARFLIGAMTTFPWGE